VEVISDVVECGCVSFVLRVYESFHVSDRIRVSGIFRGVEWDLRVLRSREVGCWRNV
jgi:hypothetical protein